MPVSIHCTDGSKFGFWGTYRLSWETAREYAISHLKHDKVSATLSDEEGRFEVWRLVDGKPALSSTSEPERK